MRIDKYLWCTRYYKTRNMASEACKKGHIRVNNLIAKPSKEVYPKDGITVRKDQINHELMVLDLPESRVAAKLLDMYRKNTTAPEVLEHGALLQQTKTYYRKKGTGRPTKKDRRDIEDFAASDDSDA